MCTNTRKRVALVVLGLIVASSTLVAQQYSFKVGQLYYKITDATNRKVAVVPEQSDYPYYNNKPTGAIAIPATVVNGSNTYSVTSIDSASFAYCSGLTSITIPSSVTSIGYGAFYRCSGLTSINIPSRVTSIGQRAFADCSGLTSINIPSSVTSIEQNTFYRCSGLTSINIPSSVTSIGGDAFYGCSGLTSINIPNSVTSIGSVAFYGCSGLTSINIPNSVTSIGQYTFYKCSGLKYVAIPGHISFQNNFGTTSNIDTVIISGGSTTICNVSFLNCSKIKYISIPNSVTSIGHGAFYGCSGFRYVTFPGHISFKDNFGTTSDIDTVVIASGSTTICDSSFKSCSKIKYISIPSSITSIGEWAFSYCSGLTSITIPNSVTSIGYGAFFVCSGLTSINIPNSVTSIGRSAFSYCSGLTSINIPSSVTSIEQNTFSGCSGLTSINIPSSVTSIGQMAFFSCSGLTSITIPNSVTSIGGGAFSGCSGLTSITIPNSVTSIGQVAFANCSGLTSINIPSSVTSIEQHTFYRCSGLDSVSVHWQTPLQVDSNVFDGVTLSNVKLIVPQGTTSRYQTANVWKDFSPIVERVSISVTYNQSAGGTFTLKNGSQYVISGSSVTEGTVLTVEATPAQGYKLDSIKVNGARISGLSFMVEDNTTVEAFFSKVKHIITYNQSVGGTLTVKDGTQTIVSGGSVEYGTVLIVEVTPYHGYMFDSIRVNGARISGFSFTVDSNSTIEAYFSKMKYMVTYTQPANGTLTVKNGSQTILSGDSLEYGTVLTIKDTPAQSYKLDSIRVNGTRISGLSFMVEDNTTVEAFFNKIKHTIIYTQPANGTLTVKDGSQTIHSGDSVEYGTVLTIEATPAQGYKLDSIKVNGTRIAGGSFTVDSNSTVEAYFSKMKYMVTYTQPANGTLTIKDGSQIIHSGDSVEYGTVLTVEATPAQGYKLDSIKVNGIRISGLSFTVNSNSTVEAYFSKVKHIITYNQSVGGTLTVKDGTQTIVSGSSVEYGTVLTVEATPAQGYKLNSIKVNGIRISGLSFTVNSNSTVKAYFSKTRHAISYTQPANGTLTIISGWNTIHSGDSVEYGTVLTVVAYPYYGYKFDSIRVNGARISGFSFTVDSNSTVEAYFSKMKYTVTYTQPANGTLTIKDGSQIIHSGDSVEYGTVLTVEATPYHGYKLDSIKVNGIRISGLSFTVNSNSTVEVYFSKMKYMVTYTQPANGTLTLKNGSQTILSGDSVEHGTMLTVEATPAQGYRLDSVRVNGVRISGLSFTVTSSSVVEVYFSKPLFTISYNQSAGGTFKVKNGSQEVASGSTIEYGTVLTFEATAAEHYKFDSIRVNGTRISGLSFTVTDNTNIEVFFGKQSYTVTYNSNMYSGKIEVTRGSEIVASGSSVEYGTQLMVRAIPNHGFEVKSLTINDQAIVNNFVFSISEAVEIKAVFAPATTALDEAATKPLAIYPNPVAEVLYLSATARTIRIYDMYGTEVAHATDTDKVEVSHLPAGIYTVRADGMVTKMVKR